MLNIFEGTAKRLANLIEEKCQFVKEMCVEKILDKKFVHKPQLSEAIFGGVSKDRLRNVARGQRLGISKEKGSENSQAKRGEVNCPLSGDNVNRQSDEKQFTEFQHQESQNLTEFRNVEDITETGKKPQFRRETLEADVKLKNIENQFDKYLNDVWNKYMCEQHLNELQPPRCPDICGRQHLVGDGGREPAGDHRQLPDPTLQQVLVPVQLPVGHPVQLPASGGERGGGGGQYQQLLNQIPDLTLRARVPLHDDPGGNGGGGGGGGDGEPPQPAAADGAAPSDLLIKISPQRWGCDAAMHTQETVQSSWYTRFNELYNHITDGPVIAPGFSFEWEDPTQPDPSRPWTPAKINQQFLGMLLVHIATRDLPGSSRQHSYIDFFSWRDHNDFLGTSLDYNLKNCLSGVNLDDPTERFSPGDLDATVVPTEVNLRSGLVIAFRMLEDLSSRNYRVRVEYKFGNPERDQPVALVMDSDLIKKVHKALGDVSLVLHNVFVVQKIADNLGLMLEEVTEEKIGELEELHCDFVVGAATVEEVRIRAQSALKITNQVRRMYKHYETTIVKISEENIITQAQAQRTFNDVDLLIRFLRNHSSQELPWVRSPSRYTTVKTQVTFSGVGLKVTENPSRMMVPIAVTAVNAHITRIKDIVQKLLDGVADQVPTSRPASKAASVERELSSSSAERKKPLYPAKLLRDAKDFQRKISSEELDEETPLYLFEDWMTKTTVYIQQIQEFEWKHEISLSSEHAILLEELKALKTNMAGLIKSRNESKRKREVEERELARTLQVSKPVDLLPNGANISNWLFYHDQFKSCSKMSRVLKIKETLPKELLPRVQNELCPDTILKLLKSIYLSEDYLIPLSRREVEKQKNFPKPNSPEEKKSFVAIWGLIQRLTQAGLERKLDFTMIGLSLSKLSRFRQENFEEKWVERQEELEGEPVEVLEREKQKLFISFIKIQENLLVRRQLQTSILKEDELPKREKAFTVRTTKHEKRFAKPEGGGAAAFGGEDYRCPVCSQKGGHPRTTGSRVGCSARTLSRCQKFRQKPQGEKLPLIKRLGCERCMSVGSHGIQECQLPADTSWLKHDTCASAPGSHHPSVCPTRPWPAPASSSSQQ